MSKVLYITANPKQVENSYSLEVGKKLIDVYQKQNPNDVVEVIDLYKVEIPFIDEEVLGGWEKLMKGSKFEELTASAQNKIATIDAFTNQFMEADKYVFATPMWNLSLPPKAKLYIDTLMIAGKTFKYTENGPVGLLDGKKAVHVHSSGGIYSNEVMKNMEFGNRYLTTVLAFMGIDQVQSILIEGTNMSNDKEGLIEKAFKNIDVVVSNF